MLTFTNSNPFTRAQRLTRTFERIQCQVVENATHPTTTKTIAGWLRANRNVDPMPPSRYFGEVIFGFPSYAGSANAADFTAAGFVAATI